ncbi:MAG TPA: hypothetical protein VFP01_11325 [Propionibacteriaceae bacterium]|nr:hypothetical protein [Propionibacteriaceae bacterium]
MPRHLSTMAIIALVLIIVETVVWVSGARYPFVMPLSLTSVAVVLLCLGVLIRN